MSLRDYNGHTPTDTPSMTVTNPARTALLAQAPAFYGQAELVGATVTWPRPLGTMSTGERLLWAVIEAVNGYEPCPAWDDLRAWLDDADLDVVRCALGYEAGAA